MARSRTKSKEDEFTTPDGLPYTLTIRQTANILHCGINTAYEAAKRGQIPAVQIGSRRIVVPTAALMALLDGGCDGACSCGKSRGPSS